MANKNKKRQQQQQQQQQNQQHHQRQDSSEDNNDFVTISPTNENTSTMPTMTTTTTTTTNGNSSPPIDDSPLRSFGEAKEQINGIYHRLGQCVAKASEFYSDSGKRPEILKNFDTEKLRSLSQNISIIETILSRNQMKVAFFGRCSNGKSTVINAILHGAVSPMDIGQTTGCFLQVQGHHGDEAYLEFENDDSVAQKMPIESLKKIANANYNDDLDCSKLVKIYWPTKKCPLLKHDIVLVDSPGIDAAKDSDEWIDKHCHDADVFVFVSNALSTFGLAEENFFRKVCQKISKPNIFILNNHWDEVAALKAPETLDRFKDKFVKKAINILSDELQISSNEEVARRTFFVSALETLEKRSQLRDQRRGDPTLVGFTERFDEFKSFERHFEESLSKSAIKTKFMKHTDKGRETIQEIVGIFSSAQSLVRQEAYRKSLELQKFKELKNSIDSLFYANEDGLQNQIYEIKKRIQIAADTEFENVVKRLSRVVGDFEMKFSLDSMELYEERLYCHVEDSLRENLKLKINGVIGKHVNPFNKVMCDISLLLSEERRDSIKQMVYNTSQSYTNDDLFDLRICKHYCKEFQADLEFRFSLGVGSIIRRMQSLFSGESKEELESNIYANANTDFVSSLVRFIINPPQSPVTVISITIGGLLVRFVSVKVIAAISVVYGSLYAYEYLTWTNSAKERAYKSQYVKYWRRGLKVCIPIISENISNSIEQKMVTTFSKVKEEVDAEKLKINENLGLLSKSLDKLKLCDEFTQELLGLNNVLLTELAAFATSFLAN